MRQEEQNRPRSATFILLAAAATGTVVRLLLLGSKSLWLDEALTIRLAQGGLDAIAQGGGIRFYHPPLYFMVLDAWMALGQSEMVLRFPSVLFGVLAIPLAYLLARELLGKREGLSAAWLTAVSPLLIWYSQEARSYSLLVFLALLSTYAFVKLFRRPQVGWWLLTAAATASALYTHYGAFLLFLIQLTLALALALYERPDRRQIGWAGSAWIAVALAYLPWARTPAAARFAELFQGSQDFTIGGFQLLLDRPVYQLLLVAGLLFTGVLVVGFLALRPRAGTVQRWVLSLRQNKIVQVLLILSFLGLLAVSVIPRAYSVKRQLLILLPFVLIGYAWFWPWAREQRRLLVSMILLSLASSLINLALVPKAQWREVVRYVEANGQTDDTVILQPPYMSEPFSYYQHRALRVETVRPVVAGERLPEIAAATDRIWLISHQRDVGDPKGVVSGWLQDHGSMLDEVEYYNIKIELFVLNQDDDG